MSFTVYVLDRDTGVITPLPDTQALNLLETADGEKIPRRINAETLRDTGASVGYPEIIVCRINDKEFWFSNSAQMLIQQQNCNTSNVDCTRVSGLPALGSNNSGAFVCPNHKA